MECEGGERRRASYCRLRERGERRAIVSGTGREREREDGAEQAGSPRSESALSPCAAARLVRKGVSDRIERIRDRRERERERESERESEIERERGRGREREREKERGSERGSEGAREGARERGRGRARDRVRMCGGARHSAFAFNERAPCRNPLADPRSEKAPFRGSRPNGWRANRSPDHEIANAEWGALDIPRSKGC